MRGENDGTGSPTFSESPADDVSMVDDVITTDNVSAAIITVRDRIRRAAERTGRDPCRVRLVAATKGVAAARVLEAVDAGATICGENRWQEAEGKMDAVSAARADVAWHFIGRLQRRKIRWLVGRFALMHAVDSLEQVEEIQRRAAAHGQPQAILLAVNVGGEASKGGFTPDELAGVAAAVDAYPSVAVRGLMTLPPRHENPEHVRPYFQQLRRLADDVTAMSLTRVEMRELSMGMSHDYEVAVEEGATLVRVGTALFGARPPSPSDSGIDAAIKRA